MSKHKSADQKLGTKEPVPQKIKKTGRSDKKPIVPATQPRKGTNTDNQYR